MFNVFPELLFLSFFAPFVLRVVLGLTLLSYSADRLYRRRDMFEGLFLEYSPSSGKTMLWVVGVLEFVLGLGLLAGAYTQIAALGIILLSTVAIFGKNTAPLFRSSRLVYLFMLVFIHLYYLEDVVNFLTHLGKFHWSSFVMDNVSSSINKDSFRHREAADGLIE